jgi:hypothetical protein
MEKRVILLPVGEMIDMYLNQMYNVSVEWEKEYLDDWGSLVVQFEVDDITGPASKIIQFVEDTVVVNG